MKLLDKCIVKSGVFEGKEVIIYDQTKDGEYVCMMPDEFQPVGEGNFALRRIDLAADNLEKIEPKEESIVTVESPEIVGAK